MQTESEYRKETQEHIDHVQGWLYKVVRDLSLRSNCHDASKLEEPEASGFRAMTNDGRLKEMTYGSDEYRAILKLHKPTIVHHYEANDHHPEHFVEGITAMNLLQLIEMLCDWKAATLRMKDGDLWRSIELNAERFGYSPELTRILQNTATDLGMLET